MTFFCTVEDDTFLGLKRAVWCCGGSSLVRVCGCDVMDKKKMKGRSFTAGASFFFLFLVWILGLGAWLFSLIRHIARKLAYQRPAACNLTPPGLPQNMVYTSGVLPESWCPLFCYSPARECDSSDPR